MADALLDVRDLTIAFPSSAPVRELSFSVRRGETVSIVGESGSGKSLTALALMRLLPRSARIRSGTMAFAGRDLATLDEPAMQKVRGREIAMIFQEPMTSLNPVLTIGAQIAEVLRLHEGLSRRAAQRAGTGPRDDLPGADDLAQSGHDNRRADHRRRPAP